MSNYELYKLLKQSDWGDFLRQGVPFDDVDPQDDLINLSNNYLDRHASKLAKRPINKLTAGDRNAVSWEDIENDPHYQKSRLDIENQLRQKVLSKLKSTSPHIRYSNFYNKFYPTDKAPESGKYSPYT